MSPLRKIALIIIFINKYRGAKKKAKNFMKNGDLQNYIGQLMEVQKSKNEIKTILA
jgi:hypothetical protein